MVTNGISVWTCMFPPLRDTPREPLLSRIQIEVRSSVEKPQKSGLPQIRQGRRLLTRWKPRETGEIALLFLNLSVFKR